VSRVQTLLPPAGPLTPGRTYRLTLDSGVTLHVTYAEVHAGEVRGELRRAGAHGLSEILAEGRPEPWTPGEVRVFLADRCRLGHAPLRLELHDLEVL